MQRDNDPAAIIFPHALHISRLLIAAAFIAALSACGGGGDTTYTVTPGVNGSGGAISPTAAVTVPSGNTTSFTVTPNSGYSASVGGTCGGSLNGSTYTTKAITGNCTVVATFTTNTKPLTFVYESQPAPTVDATLMTNFLALLNQEGAKGYFYQGNNFGNVTADDAYNLTFVNDGTNQTYSYELLAEPDNAADFITQANAEGAKGYRYEDTPFYFLDTISSSIGLSTGTIGLLTTPYVLYRKDSGSLATYTYAIDPGAASVADLLTQANGRGQSGYWLQFPTPSNIPGTLYIKNNTSTATYTYDILTWPTALNDFLAQLNNEGAKGYRAVATTHFSVQFSTIYVKDQTQAANFLYQMETISTVPMAPVIDPLITQDNISGAQGYAYWGTINLATDMTSGKYFYFYVKASNCKGFLCTAHNAVIDSNVPATTFPTFPTPILVAPN